MSLAGRAEKPYPPGNVLFDGTAFPTTFANTSPIAVTWNRRLRTKVTLSFQGDADETPEATTEYFVKHGPHSPSLKTETNMGSGTSGSFNFDFAGHNEVEVYAKKDGLVSNVLKFTTIATTGSGASLAGSIGTVTVSAPSVAARITAGGPIGTVNALVALIPHVSGSIGTVAISGLTGVLEIRGEGAVGTGAVLPITGTISVGANASGTIGSVTTTPPNGVERIPASSSGSIGSVAVSGVAGQIGIPASLSGTIGTVNGTAPTGQERPAAAESGTIGTVTVTGISGTATGATASFEVPIPGGGSIEDDSTQGQYVVPGQGGFEG